MEKTAPVWGSISGLGCAGLADLRLSLQERCVAALARVERTDFLSPVSIGEVAHVSAEITYTSKHSVEVQVNVMSENILTGTTAPPGSGGSNGDRRRVDSAQGVVPTLTLSENNLPRPHLHL